jgi:cytidylate kinase
MYFVTLTEMVGTDGEKIGKQVAGALGYAYFGEDELLNTAKGMGIASDILKLDEKSPTFLERFFSERPKIYLDRLQSLIYEVAQKGDTVFFGRGSHLLLNSFDCALHILVTGSTVRRIERVMKSHRVGREVAEKIIERSDHDKRGFIRFAFDEDWLNPKLYDIIINTDKLSADSAVKMIVDSAKSKEIKACGIDSVSRLGKLSLQRKVESALLEAGATSPHLFVTVESIDSVRLFGIAYSSEEKKTLETIVKKIGGVKHIENDVQVYQGSMSGT